ncbi:MAG: hypothetical protein ABSC88_06855 [Terracidiphilus sp.]
MSCASHSCKRISFAALMCVFILALCARADVLSAQQTLPSDSQLPSAPIPASALAPVPASVPAPPPAPVAIDEFSTAGSSLSSPGLNHGSSGSVPGSTAPRDSSQGFSLWDGTLLDAIQHGGGTRSGRFSSPGSQPVDFKSLFQGINSPGFGRGLGSGGLGPGTNGFAPGGLQFNQLNRGDLGVYLKSPADSFRVAYQDAFGTRSNGLGVFAGQGSVRATFNSSAFGNGMFNFSATSMVGSGPMAGSMHSLSGSSMSGTGLASPSAPAGTGARPTTSLSLKLSF